MTVESRHHLSGTLPLTIIMAGTAGFVDAFVYTNVTPVFVANMSGNLVRLGIFSGRLDGIGAAATCTALTGFLVGIIGATWSVDRRLRDAKTPTPRGLLGAESALLAGLAVIVVFAGTNSAPSIKPASFLVVATGAVAMGVQAVSIRRVGQVAVSTTYGTGAVVRLGEKLALAVRRAERPGDHRRRRTIAILLAVLGSYVAGAFAAAAVGSSPTWLLLPAAVPLAAATLSGSTG